MALDGALEPHPEPDPVAVARRRKASIAELQGRLGYSFADPALLAEALTHVSATGAPSTYQRLEFLGDRVLGLAVADMLMVAFPGASEGDMSRRLSELVRRETCAAVALAWDLGPHLTLGGGAAGLRRNVSILSDACESVIGAVFRDGGFEPARALVERGFRPKLAEADEIPTNPKAVLQEWALARGRGVPTYAIVERSGPDHAPRFVVAARVSGLGEAVGPGASRRAAEQEAARTLLQREGLWDEAPAERAPETADA